MTEEQLLLFPDSPEQILTRKVESLIKQQDKIRKSQYAKISELQRLCKETKDELDFLKSMICKGNKEYLI